MALFPKIERPCPYKSDLDAIMVGDTCSMCERKVYDLTTMTDEARVAFLSDCSSEVCVSYKIPLKTMAAIALSAATLTTASTTAAQTTDDLYCYEIIVGGLRKGDEAQMVSFDVNEDLPELPVIYEDADQRAELNRMFGMLESDTKSEEDYVSAPKQSEASSGAAIETSLKDGEKTKPKTRNIAPKT